MRSQLRTTDCAERPQDRRSAFVSALSDSEIYLHCLMRALHLPAHRLKWPPHAAPPFCLSRALCEARLWAVGFGKVRDPNMCIAGVTGVDPNI